MIIPLNVTAMDLRATIEGSSWGIFFLNLATDFTRPLTQKLQTLLPQEQHFTYAILPVLAGVPASTYRADAC
jgi:hypothetical protein